MSQTLIHNHKGSQTLLLWLAVIIALCGFVYFYQTSLISLFRYWNDYGTYSHGYLTVLLTAYLVYICIKEGRFSYSGLSSISLICILLLSVIWIFSYLAGVNTFQMLCVPFFIFFTLTYFYGLNSFRILLVPVFILLFTIPIWSSLLPYLQDIAVTVTSKLLSFTSLDYRIVDNQVVFSRGIFQIEESCSGLRYLLVGILLAVVYGFLNYQSYWSTLLLVLCAIIIMLIGNFIRILLVIGLGVFKGMDHPLVQDHENLGWVLFAFLLIPMFTIAKFLKPDIGIKVERHPAKTIATDKQTTLGKLFFGLVCYLITISVAPLYASYLKDNIDEVASLSTEQVGLSEGWMRSKSLSPRWSPHYILYSSQFSRRFEKNDRAVGVNMLLYTKELSDGELINVNNQLLNEDRWALVESTYHQAVRDKQERDVLSVNKITIRSKVSKECLRVWYWFDVGGEPYTKKWQVKLHQTLMIFKGRSGSAITSIATSCGENNDETLGEYVVENISQINNLIIW